MKSLAATDPTSLGPFRLLGVLGSGGMARVYLGESAAGRRVAIKVIREDLAEDPVFRTRFQREVAAARTVSPLYTAAVVDDDTAAAAPWFATAYIDGPSLTRLVETQGPLGVGAVLTLAAGLAEALTSIHEAGLVHRDLTPGNVLVDDAGPHIIDFGIAIAPQATRLTGNEMMLGTPCYIAPEVIEGGVAGPPSDVFGFGATLAFAASGKHLVDEGPFHAQILQITRGRFDLTAIPSELHPLIVRCTTLNPHERPTAADLLRVLVGSGIAKPQPGWFTSRAAAPAIRLPSPPSRHMSRRRLLVAGGVVGLVAAAAGAAAWAGVFTSARQPTANQGLPTRTPTPTPTPGPSPTGPGTIAWQARSGVVPAGLTSTALRSPTRIIIDRGERLIGANSSTVFAVGLDGRQVWTRTLQAGLLNLWGWGDAVLAADAQRLWLIDAGTGEIRYVVNAADDERAIQGENPDDVTIQITGVALSPEAAFVGVGTATIALRPTGERLWRRPRPNRRNGVRPPEGAPLATRGRWLVTHDASDQLVNLGLRDTRDGSLQWLQQYEPAPAVPPAGGPGGRPGPDSESWQRNEARITDSHLVIREVQQLRVTTLADGDTFWSATSPRPIAGIELLGDAIVVAADRVRAFDLNARTQLWDNGARGARMAVTEGGSNIFLAGEDGMSLVDIEGRQLWFQPYPTYLQNAVPDWAGAAGELGYVTFRPTDDQRGRLDFDVIAVRLGAAT